MITGRLSICVSVGRPYQFVNAGLLNGTGNH